MMISLTYSSLQAAKALEPLQALPATAPSASPATLPSESLLRGQKTVEILHNGSLYKLQATKLGKLILTK